MVNGIQARIAQLVAPGSSPGKGFYHENKLWFEYCANTCMVDVFSGDHVESRSDIWLLYKYNIIQPQPQKKKNVSWTNEQQQTVNFLQALFWISISLLSTAVRYV